MLIVMSFITLLTATILINRKYRKSMKKELSLEDKNIVLELIANAAKCEPENLEEDTRLQEDLTLDSLDIIEL